MFLVTPSGCLKSDARPSLPRAYRVTNPERRRRRFAHAIKHVEVEVW